MTVPTQRLLTIAVFYDGNFLSHINNYYRYVHPIQSNISISGLHTFITHLAAKLEGVDARYAQIVESHYFSGRLSAKVADERNRLYPERVFDELLSVEGVEQHYLPMQGTTEKGIDVWLAIEALEQSMLKHFGVVVLVAGDGDFVPLARKLTSFGIRVMVVGCDFVYIDEYQNEKSTTTSASLKKNCTYSVMINDMLDSNGENDPLIDGIFVKLERKTDNSKSRLTSAKKYVEGITLEPKNGFGFIKPDNGRINAFYHWSDLINIDFQDVRANIRVRFVVEELPDNKIAAHEVEVIE